MSQKTAHQLSFSHIVDSIGETGADDARRFRAPGGSRNRRRGRPEDARIEVRARE
jgi:hypothetical protein